MPSRAEKAAVSEVRLQLVVYLELWNKEKREAHIDLEIDRVGRLLGQPEDIMTFASPSVTKQAINRVSSFVNLEGDLTVNGSTSAYGTFTARFWNEYLRATKALPRVGTPYRLSRRPICISC